MKIQIPDCKHFTGYAPCEPFKKCWECNDEHPFGTKILIINLDAMGDVMMTTAQLVSIKKKYPQSHISWLTLSNAAQILTDNPYIDKIYIWNDETRLILSEMYFDIAMNVDKNHNCGAFMLKLKANKKLGFGINDNGAIIPLNDGAEYNFKLGIDDNHKFYINKKTGQEILAETFDLDFKRSEYIFNLTNEEKLFCEEYQNKYGIKKTDVVIGFNTGCSDKWPQKKMKIEQHVKLINMIKKDIPDVKILLLGGKQDTIHNNEITQKCKEIVINTPSTMGLRKGFCFINLADIIITGDTFGMHASISLKKWVIAWFGMSCAQEIDLYDRGVKIISDLECAPCWNAKCNNFRCVDELNLDVIFENIKNIYNTLKS